MAFAVYDRVKESSSTTGTGAITLSGAASNYVTFNTGVGLNNFTWYCINNLSANEWEVGWGQLTGATTLTRVKVHSSTNSNALVNFSAGTKEVFVTQPSAFNNQTLGRTNMVINPHGSIQQETTTPFTITAGVYFADQWIAAKTSSTGVSQAGVTTGTVSSYDPSYIFLKTTTAQGSLAAGDFVIGFQPIEGNYTRRLLYGGSTAKGSWLRFRASCTQSATCSVAIRNNAADRSFVQSFAVTTTPTDFFVYVPGDTTGTWPTGTGGAANVSFCHSAGTTFQTATLGSWQAGNFFAANTQTNLLGTLNAQLNITDVQWSASDVLLPFEPIDYAQELLRCQRYFWKLTTNGSTDFYLPGGVIENSGVSIVFGWALPTTMRAAPTVGSSGTIDIYDGTNVTSLVSLTTNGNTPERVAGVWSLSGALGAGRSVMWILRNGSSATLTHSARI